MFRGKGRSPWCTEPGAVVLITDAKNAAAGFPLDMDAVAKSAQGVVGAELCGKPFRWDQRLFTLVIGGRKGGIQGGVGGVFEGGTGVGGETAVAIEALKVRYV